MNAEAANHKVDGTNKSLPGKALTLLYETACKWPGYKTQAVNQGSLEDTGT